MIAKKRSSRLKYERYLAPTAGIYRFVALALLGVMAVLVGFRLSFRALFEPVAVSLLAGWNRMAGAVVGTDAIEVTNHVLGGVLLLGGGWLVYWSIKRFMARIFRTLSPTTRRQGVVDEYLRREQLARGPRIVALGGGTGLSTLLRGLKQHSSNITAIVTVTDDGGSSGRLVQDLGIIPPGDIRNCLVALADAEKRMTDLFQHRFKQLSGPLSGHSIGNLLIAGLVDQSNGDFDQALHVASDVLAIRGRVIPSTLTPVRLRGEMEDGSMLAGETRIVQSDLKVQRVRLEPADAEPHPEALLAIEEADLICIGPGSVFTSVIPNLIVSGIADHIARSDAAKVYVCNVMTQAGESDAFSAAEHVAAIMANVDARIFDYVMLNTGTPSPELLARYQAQGQDLVEPDVDRVRALGFKVLTGDLMSETDYVRHDPLRIAVKLMDLVFK